LIFSLFRIFYWLIELFHLSFFASFHLCCFINLRISTISKMSFFINSAASQKTNVILKKFDDWNEWIMIIKTIIKRDDVERYVNLIKIESAKSIEFDLLSYSRLKSTRSIQLICRSMNNVISSFCEKIIRIRCVNIERRSTLWRIWTFLYWRQLIDSI
jgi:hypothetical protein